MIAKVLNEHLMEDRHWPTVALAAYARIICAHDAKPNADALRMIEAILSAAHTT